LERSKIKVSSISVDELVDLCGKAEDAARKFILSRVPRRKVINLIISVNAERNEKGEMTFDVDVEVQLSSTMRGFDIKRLVRDAVDESFRVIGNYLEKDSEG